MSYKRMPAPHNPGANAKGMCLVHRIVVEAYLGRYLKKWEIVHHINENILDNRIENLIVFEDNTSHTIWHNRLSGSRMTKNMVKMHKAYGTMDKRDMYTGIVLYGPDMKAKKAQMLKNMRELTKQTLATATP